MNWQMVWESLKVSAAVTPIVLCVVFCAAMLIVGARSYGWMLVAKVAVIFVAAILMAAAIQLVIAWILHWGS